MKRYSITSSGNGAVWTITRLADGASVTLHGDDALEFDLELEATHDGYTDDDVCAEYDHVLKTEAQS